MNKIDWSDKHWKKFLTEYRDQMWLPDTVKKYAKWLNFKQGMKVADIGCGLGFLGLTYWKYFGRNGAYCGIDISANLINQAKDISQKWAKQGEAIFQVGDAYNLDLEDNSFDLVMCQTLLMHLDKPIKAITEMKRILKPGGTIFCMEPDNLSTTVNPNYSSLEKLTLEEQLVNYKINFYRFKGKKKLKLGDHTIGNKLHMLLHKSDFTEIDLRTNDRVTFLVPPYSEELRNYLTKQTDEIQNGKETEEEKYVRNIIRRDVLAGGGSENLLKKYFSNLDNKKESNNKKALSQIEKEDFSYCYSDFMFVVKGKKRICD